MEFEIYKRLWNTYTRKYINQVIIAILVALAVSGLTGAIAWLIKPALDTIFIEKNERMLYVIPVAVLALYFLKGIFTYIQGYQMAYLGNRIVTDIRNDVFKKIMYLPTTTYSTMSSGALSARVFYEVNVLQRIVAGTIKDVVQQAFTILSLTVVIFTRDWKLALIAILVLPGTGILIQKLGKKIKLLITEQNVLTADIMGFLNDTFASPRIIKSFRAEEKEIRSFNKITDGMLKIILSVAKVQSVSSPLMEFLGSIGIALIILYGGHQVINGVTTPGNFFSFMGALIMFYAPIKALSNVSNTYHLAMVSAERLFEILDMDCEEKELQDTSKKKLEGIKKNLKYDNVSFAYQGVESDTLNNVSLDIKSGEVVAFVGSSGAGKTTIVNLLPRFYDPTAGSISIDGVDIRDYNLGSLRDNISIVTQDVMLFNDSIKYNISYGRDTADEEEVIDAAKAAYAHDFIMKTDRGYDTPVGERGMNLSGGEKQRIAIARAILKNSPILILDEATSALDTGSERIVQKALDNLIKDRTTLVIAHRLSTVRNADKIVVINDGGIVETGNHAQLMALDGSYKKLHEMQYFVETKEDENAIPAAVSDGSLS